MMSEKKEKENKYKKETEIKEKMENKLTLYLAD